jgi:hypothetical protein
VTFKEFVEQQTSNKLTPLILVVAGPSFWACKTTPLELRPMEKEIIQVPSFDDKYQYLAIYDLRILTRTDA